MDAIALVALPEFVGTARYGWFDADWDGVIVPLGEVSRDARGEIFADSFSSGRGSSGAVSLPAEDGRVA